MPRIYKIRYGVIPSTDISDRVIVINPSYGVGIGPYGSRPVRPDGNWYRRMEDESGFYTKLEASILEEGFRNPIFCLSIPEGTFCKYGTSRLWIGQKHKLDIPVIIADYVNRWEDLAEIRTEKTLRSKFMDQPGILEITDETLRIDACPQTHLNE